MLLYAVIKGMLKRVKKAFQKQKRSNNQALNDAVIFDDFEPMFIDDKIMRNNSSTIANTQLRSDFNVDTSHYTNISLNLKGNEDKKMSSSRNRVQYGFSKKPIDSMDVTKNYLKSYYKENVGGHIKFSKCHVTFVVIIEGEEHRIECSHAQISGSKRVWVDRILMCQLKNLSQFFDAGLHYTHPAKIGGHTIEMKIVDAKGHRNPLLWKYIVFIDGHNAAYLDQLRRKRSFYSDFA
jgi:hypothetical protein